MGKKLRIQLLGIVFLVSSVWMLVTLFLFDIEDEINKTRLKELDPNDVKFANVIKKPDKIGNLRDHLNEPHFNKSVLLKRQENLKRKEILRKWKKELSFKAMSKDVNKNSNSLQIQNSSSFKSTAIAIDHKKQPIDSKHLVQRDPSLVKEKNTTMVSVKVSERDRLRHLEKLAPPDAPGEFGNPVQIDRRKLSPEQQKRYDELFKRNSFNQYASDMISVHRRLPDIRNPSCKEETYPKNLPSTSIIICFHNEAWSVLLRTVHSILNRTPLHLIHEILLVDDFSDLEFLKAELDEYLSENGKGKVRVVRTPKREGLIRARLLGYGEATGEILTFLDSHIECFPGWLEPLLARVAENHTRVVAPVIDMISDRSLACGGNEIGNLGTFEIANMGFNWLTLNKTEKAKHGQAEPWKTPTIAGGLFSMNRAYFTKMGTYDHGMDIWGGENLEISFRVWMCGGSLEIHPCSHVAHLFRTISPYKWGKSFKDILRKNAVRTAEVWMDEYKHIYYERLNYDLGDYGDVSDRKDLRNRLGCKSFGWYLKTMLPDMKLPETALYSGEVRNMEKGLCLDTMGKTAGNKFQAIPCHHQGGNQFFRFTVNGHIERDSACLTDQDGSLLNVLCKRNVTKWEYTQEKEIRVQNTDKCLSLSTRTLSVLPCNNGLNQKWTWTRKIHKDDNSVVK